jgi:hypothetical protein
MDEFSRIRIFIMCDMDRMWINQPSTNQPFHKLHGTNVLACHPYDEPEQEHVSGVNVLSRPLSYVKVTKIYFLSGDVVSQVIHENALSAGWK